MKMADKDNIINNVGQICFLHKMTAGQFVSVRSRRQAKVRRICDGGQKKQNDTKGNEVYEAFYRHCEHRRYP